MISERQAHFPPVHGHLTFFFSRVAFLMLIVLSLARGDDYNLSAGWNLISINLNLDQDSQNLLKSKGALTLSPAGDAYVCSDHLTPPQACWIYCQSAETITLTGVFPEDFDFLASLKKGWNFAGPVVNSPLKEDGAMAWGWNGRCFYRTEYLFAGYGYWLYWPGGYVPPPKDAYLIVDLSAGPGAASYPISYRSNPPLYGWTDEYKTNKLALRKIPAGSFVMGSPADELGRPLSGEDQHQVTLTKNLYVGVFEVTQK
ncbi:MAG TPA: hypothetical protein PKY10_05255, partial [Lentisphaeria bacterium]|nr:hypothetical protein [Lentisphaeria bacterium]